MDIEMKIDKIKANEILDSRGIPTVQVEVITENGAKGRATIPSGPADGTFDAAELRDGDKSRYIGKGVLKAVENINKKIAKKIVGMNVYDQRKIDEELILLDGTQNKSNLGANAILGVSIACLKAAANSLGVGLYRYLGGIQAINIPTPMINMLSGGKYVQDNSLNFQEFMLMPIGEISFQEKIKRSIEVYNVLKKIVIENEKFLKIGDDGGLIVNCKSEEEVLELVIVIVEKAGYKMNEDFIIALNIGASDLREEARKIGKEGYYFWKTKKYLSREEMIKYIIKLKEKYPIMSIENPLDKEDWESWKNLTKKIGDDIQLVGNDLFVTNKSRLKQGIKNTVANAISIKPTQVGTITEMIECIYIAKRNGYKTVIEHRIGETEDDILSDIAVAVNAGQIKIGNLGRLDSIIKCNRLITIAEEITS